MKVKICGITNKDDAIVAESLGADALGFIFYNKSKRYINPEEAAKIINQLSPFTLKVGVFVNESPEDVNSIAKISGLNIVQLHGDESVEYIKQINFPVIKAFRVNKDFDFTLLDKYKNCSYLLDAYSSKEYGGTGEKFNWEIIPDKIKNKIILAGGIGIDDVEFIQSNVSPYAIDLSSSIEIEPGKKDHHKMKILLEKINSIGK